ncbi:Hypothetical predicted protein [Mytilus galloprovincialis]|uniref:Fibrinogen C-terminal domain-containing protein n=1 Tax=Mytilus galloprovincialis TaxID=29158 RepID=A0A8B6F1P9_MYTGA|nr:Hypothetical predicted protein [Mytilus galloprovincialis]
MYHILPVLLFTIEINISNCGRICLSCSGVESVGECSDVEICADDEVCFTQKYQTPTKQHLFDYGCSYHQFCVSGNSGSVFGKRLTGHHILCHNCCNNTNVCNIRSLCGSDTCSSHETKESKLPRECDDLSNATTGINTIYSDGINPVQVYCIVANSEKWTRRFNGFENFDRNWEEYRTGFGSVSGEYWLAYRLSSYSKYGFSTRDQDNDEYSGSCFLTYLYGAWLYGNCGSLN